MKERLESVNKVSTWELMPLPPDRKVVKTRWVLNARWNGEGLVVRPKAQLVPKEFTQTEDIDYGEVYAPV